MDVVCTVRNDRDALVEQPRFLPQLPEATRTTLTRAQEDKEGVWAGDPRTEQKINDFLNSKDTFTDAQYKVPNPLWKTAADRLMHIRTDPSNGQTLKRAIVGGIDEHRSFVEEKEVAKI